MNSSFRTWMLPEGVVEALPEEAEKLNALTYSAMAIFAHWGYQPLRTPIFEYVDTFLGGQRSDNLAEQTIQFKDQKSGKQLGFRADFTPQVSRIDAHYLKTDKVARYAYAGEVVRSYPIGHGNARNPTVVGAELLGSASQQADIEIVNLLINLLKQLHLPQLTIELGNIDIIVELLKVASIEDSQFPQFFESLAIKDGQRLRKLCERNKVDDKYADLLVTITHLYGDDTILSEANEVFKYYPTICAEIKRLKQIVNALKQQHSDDMQFHIDLADVHGYGYHNGLIFSAYVNGIWQAVARGGRYDSYGNHFVEDNDARPSTGFSCDLTLISPLLSTQPSHARVILCDFTDHSPELIEYLSNLRNKGDIVIQQFDDLIAPNRDFTHVLVKNDNDFEVIEK